MTLRLPTVRAILIVAPHPDDEAIGAYGLIVRARRRGMPVCILVATDGAASHPNSTRWPPRRLVRARQRETWREMRRIGVPAGAIRFVGLPDGRAVSDTRRLQRSIAAMIGRSARPLLLLGPAASDDHPDHRTVAAVLRRARGPGILRWSYPVWPAGDGLARAVAAPLGTQARLAKRQAIRRYRTQTGAIQDDPGGFSFTAAQIRAFSRPAETFARVQP